MLALQPWLLFLMAGELKIALYSLHLPHACATVLSIQVVLRIAHLPHPQQSRFLTAVSARAALAK